MIVAEDTGINDDLNGIERPVKIHLKDMPSHSISVVQSLAKWKRYRLAMLGVEPGEGILTDMKAIRPDETMGPLHSVSVDQWDWEKVITRDQRHLSFLKDTVKRIYHSMKRPNRLFTKVTVSSLFCRTGLRSSIPKTCFTVIPN
jgi:aspartate--ammonia ligase